MKFYFAEEIPLQQRAAAASLLGKLVGQPMHGPRVAITLARFLPDGLVSAIRDGPGEAVVSALEQTTETPELVWTPAMAASLSAQLSTMAADLYREQMKGRVVDWDIPEQASGQHVMKDEPQVDFTLLLSNITQPLKIQIFVHTSLNHNCTYLIYPFLHMMSTDVYLTTSNLGCIK